MRCPICNGTVPPRLDASGAARSGFLPFCSERCKLIDLAKWMGEEYRIPGPPAPDTLAESASLGADDDPTFH